MQHPQNTGTAGDLVTPAAVSEQAQAVMHNNHASSWTWLQLQAIHHVVAAANALVKCMQAYPKLLCETST